MAKSYRLCPRVALLEEYMLEVSADKLVLNRVAIVIERLHHVHSPAFAQFQSSAKKYLIVLDQALKHT